MAELENENEGVALFKTKKMSPSSSVVGRQFKGHFHGNFAAFFSQNSAKILLLLGKRHTFRTL